MFLYYEGSLFCNRILFSIWRQWLQVLPYFYFKLTLAINMPVLSSKFDNKMIIFAVENVHTGVNFIDKVECCAMVRFVRITYVRPLDQSISCRSMYSPPMGLSYKTFVPASVKVGMCSGAPQYESFTATWERSKAWLKCVGWCHLKKRLF